MKEKLSNTRWARLLFDGGMPSFSFFMSQQTFMNIRGAKFFEAKRKTDREVINAEDIFKLRSKVELA